MPTKPKHFVRGKTIREWSEIIGIPLVTVYWRYYRGELESVIDGTLPDRTKRYCGLTVAEIEKRLGRNAVMVYKYIKDGTLERRLAGETIPRNNKPAPIIIDGMTTADCQAALGGVTRERVRQLKTKGLLADRLASVDCYQKAVERKQKTATERREWIRSQRQLGESPPQIATRLGLSYHVVKKAFTEHVPFVAERRELNAAIALERRPGESVAQLARRLGMKETAVRSACGGKVPFAAERRALEAQRIISEATRKDN